MKTIGERIKELRITNHKTLDDLALCTKTTRQTVFKYENNIITNIPSDKIEKLADYFKVSPAYLMGWSDNKQSTSEVNISGWVGSLINPKHREENQEKIKLLDKLSILNDQEISFMNSVADSILEKREKD